LSDSFIGDADDAATPLSPEEREGLIPTHIAIRGELNAMEQAGNADADRWVFSRKRDVLDEDFLRRLHRRMFGEVWTWAGQFRVTDKNIGDVPAWRVPADLRQLLGDVRAQIEHKAYPPDEIALRFHNRLTWNSSIPERQWQTRPAGRRSARRSTRRAALHLGKGQPRSRLGSAKALHRGPAVGRRSGSRAVTRVREILVNIVRRLAAADERPQRVEPCPLAHSPPLRAHAKMPKDRVAETRLNFRRTHVQRPKNNLNQAERYPDGARVCDSTLPHREQPLRRK
jgi:hypothetical protein